jgi:hypothetical protein
VSDPALLPAEPARQVERPGEPGWLEWLQARLDPRWRAGEWDSQLLLFTGDLASPRTAAWACRTPGCVTATRRTSGRCDGCRRARVGAGLSWAEFDAAPPPRVTRPLQPGRCTVPGCESDLLCSGLCFRHERSWRHDTSEPLEAFMTRARPLSRAADCRVPGCDRESISRRGLCHFHDERLLRTGTATRLTESELAAWIAREHPRLGAHQFSLAGLPELLEAELLYGLQQRDQTPPPLDPTLVRILVARLGDAASMRAADPQAVARAGGVQYNSAVRGLFRDLHRYVNSSAGSAFSSAPRSRDPKEPSSSPASRSWRKPRASSQPSATPAPPRPGTPSTASPNWKTSSPPPAKSLRRVIRHANR